jgi:hypothetical protein
MLFIVRFLGRRLLRVALAAAVLPLVGIAAARMADRMERDSGSSAMTRLLREVGGRASFRRR